jgi:photosystem II stability/assembly factor-like uncharacterized protein
MARSRWTELKSPTQLPLHGVSLTKEGVLWAVGGQGEVGRGPWNGKLKRVHHDGTSFFSGVWAEGDRRAVVVSSNRGLFETNDGGKSWNAVALPGKVLALEAISGIPKGPVVAVGAMGRILVRN